MFADIGFVCELCGVVNRYRNEQPLNRTMDSDGKEMPVEMVTCRGKKCKALYGITCYDGYVRMEYVPQAQIVTNSGRFPIPPYDDWHPNWVNEFLATKLSIRGDKKFLKKQGILQILERYEGPHKEDILEYALNTEFLSGGLFGMMEYRHLLSAFVETLHIMEKGA